MEDIISIYNSADEKTYMFPNDFLTISKVIDIKENKKCMLFSRKLKDEKCRIYLRTPPIKSFVISDLICAVEKDYSTITLQNDDKMNSKIIACFESLDAEIFNVLSNSELDFILDKKYRQMVKQKDSPTNIQFNIIKKIHAEYSDDYITTLYDTSGKIISDFDILKDKNLEIKMMICELIGCISDKDILQPLIRIDQMVLDGKKIIPGNKLNKCYYNTTQRNDLEVPPSEHIEIMDNNLKSIIDGIDELEINESSSSVNMSVETPLIQQPVFATRTKISKMTTPKFIPINRPTVSQLVKSIDIVPSNKNPTKKIPMDNVTSETIGAMKPIKTKRGT